jgi:hypothetical protein
LLQANCGGRQLDLGDRLMAREAHDLERGRAVRIVDGNVQHEAVDLRFGQRVCTLLLDGILRRHHQEQRRQLVARLADADLTLPHRLEQGRLYLGRGSIDLVGKNEIVKQRSALKFEGPFLGPIDVRSGEIGRKHVGGKLYALEVALEAPCQRLDGASLGEPWGTFDQQMPVGQERD